MTFVSTMNLTDKEQKQSNELRQKIMNVFDTYRFEITEWQIEK